MKIILAHIIENLVNGDRHKAICYATLLVQKTIENNEMNRSIESKYDALFAKNILHVLKGEPKEGGVAVCD